MFETEHKTFQVPGESRRTASGSIKAGRVGDTIPDLIDKKWLCARFNIPHRTSRSSKRLRKLIFTDDLLQLLGMSETVWKTRRQFTRAESILIIRYLEL